MDDSTPASARSATIESWTAALAQSTGAPGGGAASGVMLSITYALTSMVAGYTEVDDDSQAELDAVKRRAANGRERALELADADASASKSFGRAFRIEPGEDRKEAIRDASLDAAQSSADLGAQGAAAVDDLEWLARHGNPALIADIAVACGALRAAVAGARTNASFDLGALPSNGQPLTDVREQHPHLWKDVEELTAVLDRIDRLTAEVENRATPAELQD
ncbi:formiminotetrahydrofolate cyclodeaminase [Okibacterium sp. HSC-33S16]|uniref:cyclodeaminase/cyclohydrolase family protein n=1 Tax=Okibacterium sp. HSC-33S16 TaxID=2910965 RepID=UPI00209E6116|nr:cyclodeaminase/cyclohydrolase family protein [Okibacterium sp. HSC-33S16]MCP2032111.1 formiminotetrahydrofolate cyclodeaminase [Okibacterium sp. HSC-33S16]